MTAEQLLRDRYRVLHALGTGASGQVYKAVQLSTQQIVAVKLLALDDLQGDERGRRRERFRREIALCSQLYHPDIVRLLDSGELENGMCFATFEYIPGLTLAQLLAEQAALKARRARHLMVQLLPPLSHAHGKGIFHRDLKPSNIMVMSDGPRDRLKVLDFGIGIATGLDDAGRRERLTLSHEWVGTPAYAAPEQLRGELPSPKSDLYAWGLIFVECLTGSPLVQGRSLAEVVQRHLLPDPHPLPAVLRNHRLGALLERVLEKNPARRPGDAAALQAMVESIPLDDLEDAQGYLRDPGSSATRLRSPVPASDTVTDERRPEQLERRHATVLCCKTTLTGSGTIADVEQVDLLLEDTQAMAREIMGQFGAAPAQSFGDVTVGYFGLSRARDADAQLAVRAAVEAAARLEQAPAWLAAQGLGLRIQIGIHNGPVTVQLHEGLRRQLDGVTAAVATRLANLGEAEAPRGEGPRIFVSGELRELVARHADFEAGAGVTLPLSWRGTGVAVHRLSGQPRASVMTSLREQAVFVGRERELADLCEGWKESRAGRLVSTLVCGEPGIGKSRLVMELRRRLEPEVSAWVEIRCLPEWQNGSLRPLEAPVSQHLGLAGLGPVEAGLQVEKRAEALGLKAAEAVPLLCGWLSLPLPAGRAPLVWSPQKQRHMLYQLIADLLIAQLHRPVALVVEDLHWADPSTLDCLNVFLGRAQQGGGFVLMTTRAAPPVPWSVSPRSIALAGLDGSCVEELVSALLAGAAPDRQVARQIAERSDGVPLYVEELALAVFGAVEGAATSSLGGASRAPIAAVPASLRDLLNGRLEEVGEAKRLAQFAAVLGREFSARALQVLADLDELAMMGDVEQLVSGGIFVRRTGEEGAAFAFRHALIRDAAYEGMPAAGRREAHERVATGLLAHFPRLAEGQPDVLAHHWEQAGHVQRAVAFWLLAARKSGLASAHVEALAQVDRGLHLLDRFADAEERQRTEADLLHARAATIVMKRGYTDPEAARSFERVSALVPARGATLELAFAARWGLWYFHNTQAHLAQSRALAQELLAVAQTGDLSLKLSAWEAVCETGFCVGRFEESIEASRLCAAEYDLERHRWLAAARGDDPLLACLSFEAFAQLIAGRHDVALARGEAGMSLAERLGYPAMRAGMNGQMAWLHLVRGGSGALVPDLQAALGHARVCVQVAEEYGFPFWMVYGRMIGAAARIALGDLDGVDELRQGAAAWRAAGAALGRCWHLTFLGQASHRAGRHAEALPYFDEALAFCEERDSRYFQPEVLRQRAELLLDPGNPQRDVEQGLADCDRAVAVAARYGADWWALAALLTRWRKADRRDPGDRLALAAVLGRFPPGPGEPPLLREARVLVAEEQAPHPALPQVRLGPPPQA